MKWASLFYEDGVWQYCADTVLSTRSSYHLTWVQKQLDGFCWVPQDTAWSWYQLARHYEGDITTEPTTKTFQKSQEALKVFLIIGFHKVPGVVENHYLMRALWSCKCFHITYMNTEKEENISYTSLIENQSPPEEIISQVLFKFFASWYEPNR